jgi:outer membrane protein assembly factor BamD
MGFRSGIIIGALAVASLAAGCSGSSQVRYATPEEAFQRGQSAFDRGRYQRAAEYLQGVFDFGRVSPVAADAQLLLARAYFSDKQYILATSEYTRFIELYRNDPRVEQAEFERAMSFYHLSPEYQLDQTETDRAIGYFQLFMDRFPQSTLRAEAEARTRELREKLAHKQYAKGGLYEQRELYEAAAIAYETTFDKYPDTPWADDGLLGAIRAYIGFAEQSVRERQPERLQQAIDNYQRLVQVLPDSPLLKDAEALYERAVAMQQRLSGNL